MALEQPLAEHMNYVPAVKRAMASDAPSQRVSTDAANQFLVLEQPLAEDMNGVPAGAEDRQACNGRLFCAVYAA